MPIFTETTTTFLSKKVQQIAATLSAFAAVLADGSVVTWGDPEFGGDSMEVQDRLRNVQGGVKGGSFGDDDDDDDDDDDVDDDHDDDGCFVFCFLWEVCFWCLFF